MPTIPFHDHRLDLWQKHLALAASVVREFCFRLELREDALQEVRLALWEAALGWEEDLQESFTHYAWLVMRRKLLVYLTTKAVDRPRLSRKEQQVMTLIRRNMRAGQMVTAQMLQSLSEQCSISHYRLTQLVGFWYGSCMSLSASTMEQLEYAQPSPAEALHESQSLAALDAALAGLPDRERRIIIARYLTDPKLTLSTLSDEYGVSIERIRQLESQAFKRLRGALSDWANAETH